MAANEIEVRVPDIGDFDDVEIVEVLVSPGDRVEPEDSLVTLESDKATMEIPSPRGGVVRSIAVQVGDKVSEGTVLLSLEADEKSDEADPERDVSGEVEESESASESPAAASEESGDSPTASGRSEPERRPGAPAASRPPVPGPRPRAPGVIHASPLVRAYARDLGVDLSQTDGSGPEGRILTDDVKSQVRATMAGGGAALPEVPASDYARFGDVEEAPLSKIKRVSGANLRRSWLNVPHVTQHDEADISDLEAFRKSRVEAARERGLRLSPLLFVMKAVSVALEHFPAFRSSLSADGQGLVVKQYHHLGVAVDTEEGLVVPVVRDVDRKGIFALAEEVAELAERARSRKLSPADMQGGCMTISSLGGIGGSYFTPIVNAPEVSVLGVSRTVTRPVWSGGSDLSAGEWQPRLFLPLSLSYDHRVIDGADGARFVTHLRGLLEQPGALLL